MIINILKITKNYKIKIIYYKIKIKIIVYMIFKI